MSATLKITLKANEKLYINGAVIRADRKVSLEFLNDVQFLLENHVLQAEDASTPLKQLYFIVQIMLINPDGAGDARRLCKDMLPRLLTAYADPQILTGLKHVDQLVTEEKTFEALKAIRALYKNEERILRPEMPMAPVEPRLAMMAGE